MRREASPEGRDDRGSVVAYEHLVAVVVDDVDLGEGPALRAGSAGPGVVQARRGLALARGHERERVQGVRLHVLGLAQGDAEAVT